MSTKVGTVPAPKIGRSIWPAAILAAIVVLTLAVAAVSIGRDEGVPTTPAGISSEESVAIAGPSLGSTSANTPSELSGGLVGEPPVSTTTANTPTELSGGLTAAERYDLSQRI